MRASRSPSAFADTRRTFAADALQSGPDVHRTKILMLGLPRSGKTSIRQVLFNGLSERQTLYLDKTSRIEKYAYDTIIPLEIWDCPGHVSHETLGVPLSQFSTLLFIIDIQAKHDEPVTRLVDFVIAAADENPAMNLEVFVHKSDAMSDQYYRVEIYRQIQQRVLYDLSDISEDYEQIPINFALTSVFDHSIHEAFSRILHRLIGGLPYLEELLNTFCANSHATKAFLFDVRSRIYVATDASPVDAPVHAWCCDYLKLLTSFNRLYSSEAASSARMEVLGTSALPSVLPVVHSTLTSPVNTPRKVPTPLPLLSGRSQSPAVSGEDDTSNSTIRASKERFYASASATASGNGGGSTNDTALTFHRVTPDLALVALLPSPLWESRRALVEYNVVFFREGVQAVWEAEWKARQRAPASGSRA